MVKIIELMKEKENLGEKFFSLEFFPPRTEAAASNLFSLFDSFTVGGPLFIDVTWGAGGGNPSSEEVATSSLSVASAAINYCGLTTMLHLTCTYMTKDEVFQVLKRAKDLGINNILALRGDPPEDRNWVAPENGFNYCSDLVKFIKEKFEDYFCIGVAGYPNGHPDSPDLDTDIFYLKDKVDSGADFIITQLFFEAEVFFDFYRRCRDAGITCPIIPGILPIQGYASLRHLTKLSRITPPSYVIERMEVMKDNDQAIRNYGIEVATNLCRKLLKANFVTGFHFYTLNREVSVIEILKSLEMWNENNNKKELPWSVISANQLRRSNEFVRPIFWAGRPKSYLIRTRDWNEFPNGRWGDSSCPAFGDLKGYYLFKPTHLKSSSLQEMWGCPEEIQDVNNVFVKFLSGAENNKVSRLPWTESSIASETCVIYDKLIWLNENGILTTNSQPAVNGTPSDDPIFGWGEVGGYVYQKAYLEFFIDPVLFLSLSAILSDTKRYPSIQFHAVNMKGEEVTHPSQVGKKATAVTWGVFPGAEIVQPTVVDPVSFLIWKEEAFGLWKSEWRNIYEKDSTSYKLIQEIHDTYWLVNIVDNDYVKGDIFKPFTEILPPPSKQTA